VQLQSAAAPHRTQADVMIILKIEQFTIGHSHAGQPTINVIQGHL